MYRLYSKIAATIWPIGSTEGDEGIDLIPSQWELMELAGRLSFEQQLLEKLENFTALLERATGLQYLTYW